MVRASISATVCETPADNSADWKALISRSKVRIIQPDALNLPSWVTCRLLLGCWPTSLPPVYRRSPVPLGTHVKETLSCCIHVPSLGHAISRCKAQIRWYVSGRIELVRNLEVVSPHISGYSTSVHMTRWPRLGVGRLEGLDFFHMLG